MIRRAEGIRNVGKEDGGNLNVEMFIEKPNVI